VKNAVKVLQYAVRLLALLLVALGFQFWSGRSFALLPVHMRMGEMLIALLWILAGIGLRAGVTGLAISAIVYGFLAFAFAMNMGKLLPGGAHEVVRVMHLLIGLGAVGLAEILEGDAVRRDTDEGLTLTNRRPFNGLDYFALDSISQSIFCSLECSIRTTYLSSVCE
jgi:hypothetical protein